jgi:uncharacterized protein YbjT (DUF2867 family)
MLLAKKQPVRVIGRSLDHLKWVGEKGAQIMIGDQANEAFLTSAFSGADAVYLLVPPKMDADDPVRYYNAMGDIAVSAIKKAGIKKVVFLSSLGADLEAGTGPVLGLHDVERKLDGLKEVDVVFLRAGYFMENLLMNVGLIKNQKINGNTIAPDAPVQMVASSDIGAKVAELLAEPKFTGHSVLELFGQRISFNEATRIIAEKTRIPQLHYVQFSSRDSVGSMTGMGISRGMAEGFVQMSNSISEGKIISHSLDPLQPNAPTGFEKFVDEVFVPVLRNAA